jgi:ribosomal protein S3AE
LRPPRPILFIIEADSFLIIAIKIATNIKAITNTINPLRRVLVMLLGILASMKFPKCCMTAKAINQTLRDNNSFIAPLKRAIIVETAIMHKKIAS